MCICTAMCVWVLQIVLHPTNTILTDNNLIWCAAHSFLCVPENAAHGIINLSFTHREFVKVAVAVAPNPPSFLYFFIRSSLLLSIDLVFFSFKKFFCFRQEQLKAMNFDVLEIDGNLLWVLNESEFDSFIFWFLKIITCFSLSINLQLYLDIVYYIIINCIIFSHFRYIWYSSRKHISLYIDLYLYLIDIFWLLCQPMSNERKHLIADIMS